MHGSKFSALITSIAFWMCLITILGYFNFGGYSELNTNLLRSIKADNFNILTFSGMSTFIMFIIDLSKFSILGLWLPITVFLTFLGITNIIILFFWLRGTD